MKPKILEVMGAYGRRYATTEAAERDFHDGKDFKVLGNGPYMSIRDAMKCKEDGYAEIHILCGTNFELRVVHVL